MKKHHALKAAPPWELSSGRAVSPREILAHSGLPNDRFASVTGKADTEPMFPDNPYLAANRRVTLTLLSEAPPVPRGKSPRQNRQGHYFATSSAQYTLYLEPGA